MADEIPLGSVTSRQWALKWCRAGTSKIFLVSDLTDVSAEILNVIVNQPHWSLDRAALVGRGWLFENAHEESEFISLLNQSRYAVPEALAVLNLRERLADAQTAGLLSSDGLKDRISPHKVISLLNSPPFPARHGDDEIELPPAALVLASNGLEPYSKVAKERDKLRNELAMINNTAKGRRSERAEEWAKLLWAWAALKVAKSPNAPKGEKSARAFAANAILADFQEAPKLIAERTPEALKLENWIKQVESEVGFTIAQGTDLKSES